MNKLIRVVHILIILGYFLTGIYTQDNLNCRLIDFNNIESMLEIEACSTGLEFTIKSYAAEPVDPFRIDSENFLSNRQSGYTCFSTIESFTLDENTEIYSAIYLRSIIVDDNSFVEIQVFDLDESSVIPVMSVGVTNKWDEYNYKLDGPVENAKVNRINR